MTPRHPLLSVVVPVFNEEAELPELHRRVSETLRGLDGRREIVYVDDGSSDGSAELIGALDRRPGGLTSCWSSCRATSGWRSPCRPGIDHARGDYVALMHADLQDPPELLPEMLDAVLGGADVAYARRIGRDESALKRFLATAFYGLMARVARVPYQGQAGDFRVMSRRVVEAIKQMPERRRFLRGLVAWVGFEQVPVEYRRAGRQAGRGASYPQLLGLAMEALTAFSDVPLQLATLFGLLTAQLSALAAVVILVLTVLGTVHPERLGVGADRGAVPVRRPADHGGHPRPLPGAGPRRGAGPPAVPARVVLRGAGEGSGAAGGDPDARRPVTAEPRPSRPGELPRAGRRERRGGRWRCTRLLSLVLFGIPVLGHFASHVVASDADRLQPVHVVLRLVAARAAARAQPVRDPRDVRPRGLQPDLVDGDARAGSLLSPVTLAFGAAVTWNVIQLASPALGAWTVYLLCRQITGRDRPVAGRRLRVRVLALHARPPHRRPVPGAGRPAAGVRRCWSCAGCEGSISAAAVRDPHGAGPDGRVL